MYFSTADFPSQRTENIIRQVLHLAFVKCNLLLVTKTNIDQSTTILCEKPLSFPLALEMMYVILTLTMLFQFAFHHHLLQLYLYRSFHDATFIYVNYHKKKQ